MFSKNFLYFLYEIVYFFLFSKYSSDNLVHFVTRIGSDKACLGCSMTLKMKFKDTTSKDSSENCNCVAF